MKEWKKLPVTELKRLVKSRSGRIAELEIEVGVLKSLINQKVESGDLGKSEPNEPLEKVQSKTEKLPKIEVPKEPGETIEKQSTLSIKKEPDNENLDELDL
ncbi:MAG: hypothetical protein KKB03_04580 [Nanoarchaeota archaeon]|nr:hypothetical protein [Nanoarchaeota archaeon]MBU1135760.1 hypothetical protein [Nanoarchaeota archaeon]MBU2520489.1 hypothetical protein [Nanoarchaeota archaeon]